MPIIIIYIDQCADDASGFRSLLIVIFYSFSILTSAVIKWLISHPNNGNFFFYIFLLVLKIPFDFVGAWFQCDIIHSGRIAFSVLWFDSKKKRKEGKRSSHCSRIASLRTPSFLLMCGRFTCICYLSIYMPDLESFVLFAFTVNISIKKISHTHTAN